MPTAAVGPFVSTALHPRRYCPWYNPVRVDSLAEVVREVSSCSKLSRRNPNKVRIRDGPFVRTRFRQRRFTGLGLVKFAVTDSFVRRTMLRSKLKLSPRKRPRQSRARTTVQAILEAATKLLVQQGYEAATTRRIAEVAGVSVGSLYQYFPSRDAVLTSLLERHLDEVMDMLGRRLAEFETAPLPTVIRSLLRGALEIYERNPSLYRLLSDHAPRLGILDHPTAQLVDPWRRFVAKRRDLGVTRIDRTVIVLYRVVVSLLRLRAEHGSVEQTEELTRDMERVALGYLNESGPKET